MIVILLVWLGEILMDESGNNPDTPSSADGNLYPGGFFLLVGRFWSIISIEFSTSFDSRDAVWRE